MGAQAPGVGWHQTSTGWLVSGWTADGAADTPVPDHLHTDRSYRHDALLYDDRVQLVDVALPFMLDGLAAGDAVVVATGDGTASALRDAVNGDPRVHILERGDVYRARTPSAITTFRRVADERSEQGRRQVRIVGEVDFGATERDWLEWFRYESVINKALADWPLWGLCVFDTQALPEPVLDSALRTHTAVVTPAGRAANADFVPPADYLRQLPVLAEPLEATPPRLWAHDVEDFIGLRHAVAAELATVDAPRDVVEDFLLAVDEMTSNALRHGKPPVGLRLWVGGDRIVCSIDDHGPGLADPFAGYGPAHGEDLSRGGMGLWLARQLCDHVDLTGDDEGSRVRLTVRLG